MAFRKKAFAVSRLTCASGTHLRTSVANFPFAQISQWRRAGLQTHLTFRCSEAGVAETAPDVSINSSGAEPFSDLSPVASPPLLSGSPEFYVDAALALVTTLEDAEDGEVRVVPESDSSAPGAPGHTNSAAPLEVLEPEKPINISSSEQIPDAVPHEQSVGGARLSENHNLLDQMREILVFAGPALGIWLAGPLMSIIDTAVVGQSSSVELAALGNAPHFTQSLPAA